MTIPTPEGLTTRPVGLDYGAIMLMAEPRGVDLALLSDLLPRVEAAIINPPETVREEPDDEHA